MAAATATKLDKPLYFAAKVVKGFQRGSKQLGWPTANLEDSAVIRQTLDSCELGVYCGWCTVGPASPTATVYKAAVGTRAHMLSRDLKHEWRNPRRVCVFVCVLARLSTCLPA